MEIEDHIIFTWKASTSREIWYTMLVSAGTPAVSSSICSVSARNSCASSFAVRSQRPGLRISKSSCRCRAAVEEQTQMQSTEQNERVALGSVVVESTEPFPEPSKDFWEGEQWEVTAPACSTVYSGVCSTFNTFSILSGASAKTGHIHELVPCSWSGSSSLHLCRS